MTEINEIVKVGQGNRNERSLKCTIPLKIADKARLKKGDQLVWKYKNDGHGGYIITVKKLDL